MSDMCGNPEDQFSSIAAFITEISRCVLSDNLQIISLFFHQNIQ